MYQNVSKYIKLKFWKKVEFGYFRVTLIIICSYSFLSHTLIPFRTFFLVLASASLSIHISLVSPTSPIPIIISFHKQCRSHQFKKSASTPLSDSWFFCNLISIFWHQGEVLNLSLIFNVPRGEGQYFQSIPVDGGALFFLELKAIVWIGNRTLVIARSERA